MQVFAINGREFAVDVVQLKREFDILQTNNSGRTMDGSIYREPVGTYYNYTMTIRPRPAQHAAIDEFWEMISKPAECHVCTFPYNQQTLTQEMYITGGEQSLVQMGEKGATWGEITIRFIATRPAVMA